jgi:hypothetical protein
VADEGSSGGGVAQADVAEDGEASRRLAGVGDGGGGGKGRQGFTTLQREMTVDIREADGGNAVAAAACRERNESEARALWG